MKGFLRTVLLVLVIGILTTGGAGTVYAKSKASKTAKTAKTAKTSKTVKTRDSEVHLEQVHTIYWKATLRRDLTKGKKVLAKRGSSVVVTNRGNGSRGKSRIVYGKSKRRASVPNSWLSFRSDKTTISKGDYNRATKEAFINRKAKVRKGEKYLIWVSLDKQRVNIFRSSKKKWKLSYVFKCSTGNVTTPTRSGWHRVDYKSVWVKGLKWFTEVVGGGMHRWPGRLNKKLYGKHVASGGCIRLISKNAEKVYKMIPVRTRVLVY